MSPLKRIYGVIRSLFGPKRETGPRFIRPAENKEILLENLPADIPIMSVHETHIDGKEDESSAYLKSGVSIQATSMARFMNETFNPYRFSRFRDLYKFSEPSFYKDYQESYMQNPWTQMVITFLCNEIFSNGSHFEGPGARAAERFFAQDDTWSKIKLMVVDGFVKGNGFLDLTTRGGKLIKTRLLIPDYVQVSIDLTTGERKYFDGITGKELKKENLGHFMPREINGVAYGMSLLRPNYVFLQALLDSGGDVIAALKRTGYAPIVARLDLEGLKEEDKRTAMENFKAKLSEIQSATNNFIIDKRHDISLLGQGAAGARLLPTNDLLMPVISVVLFSFGIPLGLFLQTGANKAIIDEQRKAMQRFYEEMRFKIKSFVESIILPKITNSYCTLVFNKPDVMAEETQKAMLIHSKLYEDGLLSREYILDFWDIEDKGETFYIQPAKPLKKNESEKE